MTQTNHEHPDKMANQKFTLPYVSFSTDKFAITLNQAVTKPGIREGEPPAQCPVVDFTEVTYG